MAFTIVANQISSQSANQADMMYRVITTIIAGPWGAGAIRASGDGQALFSMAGSVFTQGVGSPLTAGSIGNTNAWFVIAPPDDSWFLCYQRSSSFGISCGAVFSLNPFTGGSPSATVRPTSVGEVTIRTSVAASSFCLGTTSPAYVGAVTHGIFGDASEEYTFGIFNYASGYSLTGGTFNTPTSGGLFIDVCEPSFVNVDQPSRAIVCPFVDNGSIWNAGDSIFNARPNTVTPHSTNNRPFCWYRNTTDYMVSCGLISPGGNTNPSAEYRFGWEGTRQVNLIRPVWISVNQERGIPVIKGRSRLFRTTTSPNTASQIATEGRVGCLSFTSDLQWWFLGADGSIAVPWDGVTDMVIGG